MSSQRLSLRFIIGSVGIFAFIFLTYTASLQNGFVEWDDGYLITNNHAIRTISPQSLRHIFRTYDPELYIPLTFLSYQIDYAIAGLRPTMFHFTSLLLHAGNALLVAALCYRLSRNVGIGLACGFLWAVHPLNTEAVAWASARKDLLSAFFFLCTIILYIRSRDHNDSSYFLRLTSYVSFLLGLLAKVSIAPLPIILLLIEWFLPERANEKRATYHRLLPFFALSILFGIIALVGKTNNIAHTSPQEMLQLSAKAATFSLQKIFLPFHLSVLYPYTKEISFGNLDLLLPLGIVLGLLMLLWKARRKVPLLTFAIGWYLLLLLPTSTAFRKGDDIELDLYFASDRYAYLPSIGILFLVASLTAALCARAHTNREETLRQTIAIGLAGVAVVSFGILSFHQAQTWKTTETLFQNVIRFYPNAHIAHNNIGLFEQGRGNFPNAIDHYRKAIAIRPTGRTYYNLGLTYIAQGEREKAVEANRTALQFNPRHARAHLNLGGLLLEDGKVAEAIDELNTAIAIDPALALAHFNLGLAYERLRKIQMAEKAYTAALKHNPNDIETLVSLAALYVRGHEPENALTLLQHAIALQPHHPRYESLLLEIARWWGKKL